MRFKTFAFTVLWSMNPSNAEMPWISNSHLTSFLPPHPSQRQRHSKVPTWSQPKAIFHQTLHQASSSSSAGAISSAESQRTSTWTSWRATAWVVPSLLRSYQWSHQLSHLGQLPGNSDPICSWAAQVPTEGWPNPWRSLSPKIPWIPTKRLAVSKGQRQQRNDRGPHCEGIRPTLSDVWAHGAHLYGSDHPWCERCTFASKSPNEIGHSSGEPAVAISSCNWQLDRNMRYQTTAPSFFSYPTLTLLLLLHALGQYELRMIHNAVSSTHILPSDNNQWC